MRTSPRVVAAPGGLAPPWAAIRAALGLLTVLPLGGAVVAGTGSAAFGLVGAGLGLVAALPLLLIGTAAPLAAAGLALGLVALLSGGLHLDGLADTADALAAPTPERAEAVRKDPHLGAAGTSALAITLIVQAGALSALLATRGPVAGTLVLVAATAMSRAVVPLAAWLLPGRGTGLGSWFVGQVSARDGVLAAGTTLGIAALLAALTGGPGIVVATVAVSLGGLVLAAWLARLRGGLDGDGLGALVELTLTLALLGAALVR